MPASKLHSSPYRRTENGQQTVARVTGSDGRKTCAEQSKMAAATAAAQRDGARVVDAAAAPLSAA